MRRTLTFFLCALVLLGTAGSAVAESPVLDRILANGKIRIGMTGDQAPLNVRARGGAMIGFEVDMANLLATAMGVQAELVTKPFPQLLPALKSGKLDVVLSGMSITAGRSTDVLFAGPYMMSGKSILTKSQLLARAESAAEVNQSSFKLVALEGSTSAEFVRLALPEAQLTTTPDYGGAVQAVLNDTADAMVADMPICLLTVMRYPGQGLVTLDSPLTMEPLGMAVPATDPQLHNLITNYLTTFEALGITTQLRSKWFEDSSWLASLP